MGRTRTNSDNTGGSGHAPRLLSTEEAAAFLGIRTSRLHDRWRSWGLQPYAVGRTLRWRESDLETWLTGRRVA